MEQIVVGVFENQSEIERAKQALFDGGIAPSSMNVHAAESSAASAETSDDEHESGIVHFFRSLFGMDKHQDYAKTYGEAVRRGHCVLTVHAVDANQADRAQSIMEECGAIDVDERSTSWNEERAGGTAPLVAEESTAPAKSSRAKKSAGGKKAKIPVVEEELRVGKREVGRGGVRVFARMNETPAEEKVQLREERATVERRPVDRPATEADFAAFKEGAIEVRETAEEAVVDKRARVVEEVYVGKETTQHEETVRDSVRHTDVQIDRLGEGAGEQRAPLEGRDDFDDDDAAFRAHWQSHYADGGGQYADYAPAYGYGSSLGSSSRYAGRSWDDIEPDARRDWEERYPNSTWERFKDAVRHGWERLTGSTGSQRIAADQGVRHPAP
jgi:uncharacterized protein (TIGR02271 family)